MTREEILIGIDKVIRSEEPYALKLVAIKESLDTYAMEFLKERVGYLRQWLNEDRITDPKKMVSNEDILSWFNANNKQDE
jgi:hypothetical protein